MNVLVITIVCVLVVLLVTMGFVVQFVITRKAVRYAHAPDCEKDKGTEEMPCIDLGLLQLDQLIGQGKYGSVWKATLDGKIRAVKVFPLEYQMYWQSEKDFYTSGISHPNLLKVGQILENGLRNELVSFRAGVTQLKNCRVIPCGNHCED